MLLCFCFSIFSINCFAVDEDSVLHYEYDDEGNVVGSFYNLNEYDLFMPFSLKSPNHTWFEPEWIPWESFPSYVKEIAYCSYYNINFDEPDYYRTPFIMLTVHDDDTYTIRAGWDVALWYRPETGSTTIGFYKTMLTYCEPELYMATFDIYDNIVSDWTEKSYNSWGNSGAMYNFSGSGINIADSDVDVYTYGVNACLGSYTDPVGASLKLNTDGELVYSLFYNRGQGILDSSYCGFTKDFYTGASDLYISSFTPFNLTAPSSSPYVVYASDDFGINTNILNSSNFIPLDNLPYGSDSSIVGFTTASNNSFSFIMNSSVESYFFRNWSYSSSGKLMVGFVSKSPIYRIGYTKSGGLAAINGAYGLTQCSNNLGSGTSSWHTTLRYYLNNGFYVYVYSIPAGSVGCTISRNSVNLKIDDSLSSDLYPYEYSSYPTVYTIGQLVEQEQNSILNEQNTILEEQNTILEEQNTILEEQNSILHEQNSILDEQNTLIDEGNKTQAGIWETLKGIPEAISDKIKSLFVPDEGFFDTYTTEFQDYFSDRFGLLYELPEAGVNILQQFIDYKPVTDGYYIPVPEVVFPVTLEDGTVKDFVILEKQNYVFDFLSEGVIGTVYKFYRAFCWLVAILSLIALAVRKYNKITGGG